MFAADTTLKFTTIMQNCQIINKFKYIFKSSSSFYVSLSCFFYLFTVIDNKEIDFQKGGWV